MLSFKAIHEMFRWNDMMKHFEETNRCEAWLKCQKCKKNYHGVRRLNSN
jgi:hypothetical protein